MSQITIKDVLAAAYRRVQAPAPLTADNTALLLIDVQHLATPDHLQARAVAAGLPDAGVRAALSDYSQRFHAAVANCARLLEGARSAGLPCIHVKIEALSGNARDTGPAHRSMGWCYPPGSAESQFLPEVTPRPGEITITKTVSGAFTATNLDSILRHMKIEWLVVAGFETDECIEATGRAALDLGYLALFATDACTAYEADAHRNVMAKYASWGLVRTTVQLLEMIDSLR
ncbi:MAG: isochorismatase family cysteine hydrolase [Pseudomonadales bacterium]